jgi:hypothetical protein
MPTMASYDLKITGLVKSDDPNPETVFASFKAIMDWGTPWAQKFGQVNEAPRPITKDTTILETWAIPIGSRLAVKSVLVDGSTLNDQPVKGDLTLHNPVDVVATTVLRPHSVVAVGSTLRREPFAKLTWDIRMEDSPKWDVDATGTPLIVGNHHMLSQHGAMAVVRGGALGEHWDNQSAPDELWWFYKYKTLPWFSMLMGALVVFNRNYAARLWEPVRVRDLKWYCGNGAGP